MPLPGLELPAPPSLKDLFGKGTSPGDKLPNDNNEEPRSILDDIVDTITGKKEQERKRQERIDKLSGKTTNKKSFVSDGEFKPLFNTQNYVS